MWGGHERTAQPSSFIHAETRFARGLAAIRLLNVHADSGTPDSIREATFVNLIHLLYVADRCTDRRRSESLAIRVDRSPNLELYPRRSTWSEP